MATRAGEAFLLFIIPRTLCSHSLSLHRYSGDSGVLSGGDQQGQFGGGGGSDSYGSAGGQYGDSYGSGNQQYGSGNQQNH